MPGILLLDSLTSQFHEFPSKGTFIIGRQSSCDLFLPDSRVSRLHASMKSAEGRYFLKDHSRNGTQVNHRWIKERWLHPKDLIQVGPFFFEFCLEKPRQSPLFQNITQEIDSLDLIGNAKNFQKTLESSQKAAQSDFPVLIQGETGTGKELLARYIHQLSRRHKHLLLSINCATLNSNLMESELFGHEKGAFTSASERRKGVFESAQKGTLFLDEISELPLGLQAKLLRVLEEKQIRRVGAATELAVDVRLLASTNRNLKEEMRKGKFREDLFHRLHILVLQIPPLRQRKEDISPLANFLLKKAGFEKSISSKALNILQKYHWPGNIRELRNCLYRAAVLHSGKEISEGDLDLSFSIEPSPLPAKDPMEPGSLKESEEDLIRKHLEFNRWSRAKTANSLGISRSTLFLKMRKFGLLEA